MRQTITFTYKNHRGEVAERTVSVDGVDYLRDPGFGYKPGWFVSGLCHTKQARRSFSLENIQVPDGKLGWYQLIKF